MTQTLPQAPAVGFRFTHSRFLDQNSQPLDMIVTAVRRGTVYYRGADGKGKWSCAVDRFAEKVKPGPFYVTVRDGGRTGALVGPFATNGQAEEWVEPARRAAEKIDGFAGFYAFGTSRVPGSMSSGALNEAVGYRAEYPLIG